VRFDDLELEVVGALLRALADDHQRVVVVLGDGNDGVGRAGRGSVELNSTRLHLQKK